MKHIAQQMVLFGASAPMAVEITKAVSITPRYAVQKDDNGKTIKDKNGNAVLAKDDNGQHILVAETIALLPRSSKDKTDLKDVTGLVGQGLMQFAREASDAMCDAAIAEIVRLRASGQYTFARETRNKRNGAIALTIKPVFGGKSVVTSTDEELAKELERRGYSVEKPASNGEATVEVETPEPETPKPAPKPAKGKTKTVPATA